MVELRFPSLSLEEGGKRLEMERLTASSAPLEPDWVPQSSESGWAEVYKENSCY